jgi:hypothetical protein
MTRRVVRATMLGAIVAPALGAAVLLAGSGAAFAVCQGLGAPTNTDTRCLTAVQIPNNPAKNSKGLQSYDISWVNPDRAEYYLADRSNAGIDIIDTGHNIFKRRLEGFIGAVLNANGTVNNNISGPDGVVTHGRWLYAGDGNSTLKVFDLNAPTASALKASISTGGSTRVDEMDLTTDGRLLLVVNNAEDPPYATLFRANGDANVNAAAKIIKITVDPTIMPAGGAIEQPAWDPKTERFYVSIPVIRDNPTGCIFTGPIATITCDGGLMIIDPEAPTAVVGAFDSATNTGVLKLNKCGPNGATVGPHDNLLLGCTPQNNPNDKDTLVINATTKNFAHVANITGSDEVWFNRGDRRYYTGSSRDCGLSGGCPNGGAVLGVIDETSVLIEKIPQSSGSHSVAADAKRNFIYVPQSGSAALVGPGGDTTTVGAQICGGSTVSNPGCVAVYFHDVDEEDDRDRGHER